MKDWNSSIVERFAIYQWGVETIAKNAKIKINKIVRNLPMRSWNYSRSYRNFLCLLGSQFTNEELKQLFLLLPSENQKLFAIYQWGVETRLSKSILKGFQKFAIYQWGVETFFKQLAFFFAVLVRNLPMKSWNKKWIETSFK